MAVERMWRAHDLRSSYDVVIIGAGVHGLAIAYYLGKRGVTNVAVVDKGYLGGGAAGRNTAIIRSNYRTPQGVAFYDESVKLYENLAIDGKGLIYVSGFSPAISVFDANGGSVGSIGGNDVVFGLAVDDQNAIYACFRNEHVVRKYVAGTH